MNLTVKELKLKLKNLPDDWEIYIDDLTGGRIGLEEFRIESPAKARAYGGIETDKSIVVLSDKADFVQISH